MSPDRLGPYRIVRKLGRGGMGTVYLGIDDASGQTAAVKLLSAEMAQQSDFRERFKAEIETLCKLHHPNIVQIFGFGEQDTHIYYAMEYVSGSSLEEQLGRGRVFSWRDAATFGIDTAKALRHAHDRGVIHRDIKPGNLLLTDDGGLKLSDFGIARLFGCGRLTGVGSVLGTAEFMAPEQADGRPVDPRSDLYSLGGVLYVLLARRPLYAARSFIEMLEKQRSEKPAPLHQMASDVPVELEQIIHRLLEKEPERRFATAMVLQRRLEAMLELLSMPPEVPSPADSPASGAATDLGAPVNPLGATVAATQPPERLPVTPVVPSGSAPLPSDPTPSAATPPADAPASPPRSSGRFVPVRPGELDQRPQERPAAPWISPQTWALVAGLLAVGLAAWYMLQPPSADALYERIQRRIEDDSTESLLQADEDIRHFIDHFSDDPRIAVMAEMTERIEVARQEKRLELQAKGVYVQPSPSPVEQCYIDAVNTARIDPGAAMAKYRAIIQLFEPSGEIPARNRRCVEIARRRLQELAQQDEAQSKEHLAELARQIERADELSKTDPQRAGAVYQAAIVLYQGKPWADPWIARARAAAEECRKRADKRESPLEPSGPKR